MSPKWRLCYDPGDSPAQITLPGNELIVTIPVVANGRPSSSTQAADGPRSVIRRRILLIEDNADARDSLALLLKLVGHDVISAEDGRHGIEAATACAPDVVLIDIGLPDMDGYQVAAKLKSLLSSQPILVALTGFDQPEDRQRALEAGFHTHLTKPVDLQTLQTVLTDYCRPANS